MGRYKEKNVKKYPLIPPSTQMWILGLAQGELTARIGQTHVLS